MITLQKDRYETLEYLGSGATSRVEKARDNVIGRSVAIKTFSNGLGDGLEEQFLREAQIIGQLSNPCIVQLYDVGINEHGIPFLVMEYVAGKTLDNRLVPSALTAQRACAWAADLAGALALAHRAGIIHGDVKPGNILVTAENKVKLGDFGIARFAAHISGSGRLLGTPAYLAPEQIQGQPLDPRSDQFALGIVLYQMLTGAKPFDGSSLGAVCAQILNAEPEPPSRRNPAVSQELDRIVARCLAKNPADRFSSCDELASALYPFARTNTQTLPMAARKRSWWSQPSGQRDVWLATAACLLLAFSVPAIRSVRARMVIPPPPAALHFSSSLPQDALNDTLQIAASLPVPDAVEPSAPKTPRKTSATQSNPSAKRAAGKNRPSGLQNSSSKSYFAALPSLPLVSEPAPPAVRSTEIQIEITSAVNEGILTVFADRELLFTQDLSSAKPGQPMRFEHSLSAGPHQFRVALYKADRSLQVEKEGLAEMRADASNTLAVHVARRVKMLVHRELTLDVTWPGAASPAAASPSAGHNSGAVKSAALTD
jgi:serine/threonine protein kinase